MKTIYTLIFVGIMFIMNTNSVTAQVHEGGIPIGFDASLNANNIPVIEMPIVNIDSLQKEDLKNDKHKEIPWRFGYNHAVNMNPNNAGVWTTLSNGDRLWQVGIHCPNAVTINLAFDEFHLPKGAKMFIYNQDRTHVIGAFTDKTNQADHQLGCDLIKGNSIVVEYYEPANVAFHGTLNIFRVTHGYRSVFHYLMKSFGGSGSCENNVICDPNWAKEKRAVACIVVGGAICSGSLINDVESDGIPYFLTANHCSHPGENFGIWMFRFNWESPTCTPNNDGNYNFTISGATQKAHSYHSDFDLLRLSSTPDTSYHIYYNGWSNIPVFADSTTGIHHPSGDVKKISYALSPTQDAGLQDMGNGFADCWRVGQWTDGVTEGGSSGSPLYDQNHRFIGQLYGGASDCQAATTDWYDVYGKFSTSWAYYSMTDSSLKPWLDPNNTGALVNDGFDPNVTPFALDAGIININSPTQTNYCTNTISPVVILRNYGSSTLTNVDIKYQLDNLPVNTFHWTGSLALHGMETITLPNMTATLRSNKIRVYTSSPNGGTDLNGSNDTASVIFATQLNVFPIIQNFESPVFPSGTWRIGNPDGYDTWYRRIGVSGFGLSTACMELDNFTNTGNIGQLDSLYSPYIDLTFAVAPIKLSFSYAYRLRNNSATDSLFISVSKDCGQSWERLESKGGANMATVTGLLSTAFTPSATQWKSDTLHLDSLAGVSNLQFAFTNYSNFGNNLYLDDIKIDAVSTLGIPAITTDKDDFILYPNPTNGLLNLSIALTQNSFVEVKVLNLLGDVVAIKNIDNTIRGNYSIDLSTLAQSIYFVQIKTNRETIVRRIALQK